ncbi:MAG: preprotein translocase subunit SecE [Phycisphaeraceae bacterium]|nr:preprotein translocase subunit SecE [Phycisphaeraceae bacterium]
MAIGIYKPGQGYWVRVLTASLLAVVVLATSAWVYSQAGLAFESLPKSVWSFQLKSTNGAVSPGDVVTFLAKPARPGDAPASIGTAKVLSYDQFNTELRVSGFVGATPESDLSRAGRVSAGGAAPFTGEVTGSPTASAAVEPLMVQGAAVGIVLLIGAVIIYWVVAIRPGTVDFLVATDTEMKKVNWSTRKDIVRSTGVVIFASVLIAGVLYGFDQVFSLFFRAIGILATGSGS